MADLGNSPTQISMETFEMHQTSLTVPTVKHTYDEDQNAPLLSIDYIHDSLSKDTNNNSLIIKQYDATNNDGDGDATKTTTKKKVRKESFITQNEASIPSSMFNLCNTIIGAGMLGLPEAIAQTGYVISAFLFISIALINIFTLNLNMSCAKLLAPNSSYTALCNATIPKLQYLVDSSVAITCFGVCCAYFVVIGDLLPDVVSTYFDDNNNQNDTDFVKLLKKRETWIVIYLFIFILPTIRLKKMDSLRFTSFFALLCFVYIAVIIVLYASINSLDPCRDDGAECDGDIEAYPTSSYGILKIFKAIPIYMFAMTCHFNTFSICNELKNNTMKRINIVIVFTITIVCIIYCIVGYFGYFTYGTLSDSNILTKYPKHNSILIVRIGLSLAIAFSYPVLLHPCRNCLGSLIFDQPNCEKLSFFKFWLLTAIIVIFSFGVSMVSSNLGDILGIVGSTGISVIAFILPGLFYYYMDGLKQMDQNYYQIKKYCGMFFVIFGMIMIPFCIVMQFIEVD